MTHFAWKDIIIRVEAGWTFVQSTITLKFGRDMCKPVHNGHVQIRQPGRHGHNHRRCIYVDDLFVTET